MDLTIKYYLDVFIKEHDINTLVLGCTHYPLLTENIKRIYPEMKIINSSKEAAIAVQIELEKRGMLAGKNTHENVFYASDLSENFVNMIQTILGKEKEELNIQFKNLDI